VPGLARTLADVDWDAFVGTPATLLTVVDGDKILLIRKKRGLGAGKITPPGGKIEPGETPLHAAMREVEEEVGVRARDVTLAGRLRFAFVDGLALHVTVFRADGHAGEPRETDEAAPIWVDRAAIPWDAMWADDRLWLPRLLERRPFDGRFVFEGDRMLDAHLDVGARE
jgi:8-oxo-dGTP diphosphatase